MHARMQPRLPQIAATADQRRAIEADLAELTPLERLWDGTSDGDGR